MSNRIRDLDKTDLIVCAAVAFVAGVAAGAYVEPVWLAVVVGVSVYAVIYVPFCLLLTRDGQR